MMHLYLSASHKSSGKTSIAIGLLAAFAERGLSVQPFKKGPDYIDPLWLTRASERPCYNLDYNTQSDDEIRALFARHAECASFALIEGNKGLYDGLDTQGRDCNAALAKLLQTPVILVLDTQGITRGLVPLVLGYQAFDPDVRIAGLILNRVASPRHEKKLRASLEHYTDVPILGAVGRHQELIVTERHLGLTTPCEQGASLAKIECLKMAISEGVDVDRVLDIAECTHAPAIAEPGRASDMQPDIRIGVARDAAFSFYYQDDLEALERAGAELVFFNALKDEHLRDVDGLFLGGGFPETQMAALEANTGLRAEIRNAAQNGLPVYAECGGMMYLCRSITWRGERCRMAGVIPADAVMHDKPQGRGLVRLEETGAGPWSLHAGTGAGAKFCAHEFHYAALENTPDDMVCAYRVLRGRGIDGRRDGIVIGNVLANFCHLRDTDQNHWAQRFAGFVRDCRDRGENHQRIDAAGALSN
jgi:cobyrinic acid a,c-diamide synthase